MQAARVCIRISISSVARRGMLPPECFHPLAVQPASQPARQPATPQNSSNNTNNKMCVHVCVRGWVFGSVCVCNEMITGKSHFLIFAKHRNWRNGETELEKENSLLLRWRESDGGGGGAGWRTHMTAKHLPLLPLRTHALTGHVILTRAQTKRMRSCRC